MISPYNLASSANSSSVWSSDSGYDTISAPDDAALSPVRIRTLDQHSLKTHIRQVKGKEGDHVFNNINEKETIGLGLGLGWSWSEALSNSLRPREDSLVDPITTKLHVFTTRDASDNFVLPEIPSSTKSCLECDMWQLTNPGADIQCQRCRLSKGWASSSTNASEFSQPAKEALPQLDARSTTESSRKRPRSITRCAACEVPLLVDTKFCSNCSPDPNHTFPSSPSSFEPRVKRSRAGRVSKLPVQALNRLQAWLNANQHNPYPNAETKRLLASECGITEKQVNTWFTNARARQMSAIGSSSEGEANEDSEDGEAAQSTGIAGGQLRRGESVTSQSRAKTSRRGKKKDYRRHQNVEAPQTPLLLSPASMTSPVEQAIPTDQETWQCTFCLKALVPKSWRRHEDTQHRPKTQAARWTCMLHGPHLTFPNRANTASVCAFCMVKNPTEEHFLHHHRIEDCAKRDTSDRTFYRPDHLRQHIKNFHNATLYDIVQARWKTAAEVVAEGWTCGFCGDRLETWDKRETHIANHFKDGMTMASWREYSDMEHRKPTLPTDKRKPKEEDTTNMRTNFGARIGSLFKRPHPPHTHAHTHAPADFQAPAHQTSPFINAFASVPPTQLQTQQQPQQQQQQYHHPPHNISPQSQSPSPSTYAISTPPTLSLPLTHTTQPPTLPDLPAMDPLMLNYADPYAYTDWTLIPTTLDSRIQQQQTQQYTHPHLHQLSPASVGVYDAPVQQQPYPGSLGLDLYGQAMEFQGSWGEVGQQGQGQQTGYGQQQQRRRQ